MFSFGARLDFFINVWDERFHALVAKNMMNHFFVPTLYDQTPLDMVYEPWERFHIWLQKQPLFLWQIAAGFKLFGVSEYTLRLPSIILGVILCIIGYRTGYLLVNKNVGFMTSVLIISSFYLLELIVGRQELDHNDVSFITYISLSIWALVEYYQSNNKKWIYLIGTFSGFAILCKWLVGFLVYLGWIILEFQRKRYNLLLNKNFIVAILVSLAIFIPWQIYTFYNYYELALATYKENASHFTHILHGHHGTPFYHFDKITTIYGAYSLFLIVPGFFFLYKRINSKPIFWAFIGMIAAVYLFFTLAATKMPSFTAVVFLPVMIAIATLIHEVLDKLLSIIQNSKLKHGVYAFILFGIVIFRMDFGQIYSNHIDFANNNHIRICTNNAQIFRSIRLPENYIVFNIPGRHFVEGMFYTGLICYGNIPTEAQYNDLKSKGKNIAILNAKQIAIPAYLSNDILTVYLEGKIEISE